MSALVAFVVVILSCAAGPACHPERAKRVKGSLSIQGSSAVFEQRNSLGAIAILSACGLRMTRRAISETLATVSGKPRKKFRTSSESAHFR